MFHPLFLQNMVKAIKRPNSVGNNISIDKKGVYFRITSYDLNSNILQPQSLL